MESAKDGLSADDDTFPGERVSFDFSANFLHKFFDLFPPRPAERFSGATTIDILPRKRYP